MRWSWEGSCLGWGHWITKGAVPTSTVVVGCLLALVVASCGSGTKTAEAGSPTADAEPTSAGPSVTELVASEWSAFCTSDTPLYGSPTDSWVDHSQRIEAALAPGGSPTTADGAEVLALLRTATKARGALAEAIDAAMASQAVVDYCSSGDCTVLFGESGVLVVDFMHGDEKGGAKGPYAVEELDAFREAIGDLATRAQELGLEDCSLLAGDE